MEISSGRRALQNGTSEALVKSVKKAIKVVVGESVMTFSELQTVCFERQQTWLTKGQYYW